MFVFGLDHISYIQFSSLNISSYFMNNSYFQDIIMLLNSRTSSSIYTISKYVNIYILPNRLYLNFLVVHICCGSLGFSKIVLRVRLQKMIIFPSLSKLVNCNEVRTVCLVSLLVYWFGSYLLLNSISSS